MFGGQTIKKATNSNIALVHEPDTMLIRDKKSPRRNVHFSNLRREKTLLVRFLWSIRFGIEVTDASNTLRLIPHTGSLDHNSATARFRYSHKSSHSHTHKNTTEKKRQQQHQLQFVITAHLAVSFANTPLPYVLCVCVCDCVERQ